MPEGPEVKISTDFLKKNVREVKSINIESFIKLAHIFKNETLS